MYIYNIYSFVHNSCTTYRLQKKNFIWFRRRVRNKNLLLPVSIDTSILLFLLYIYFIYYFIQQEE